MRKGEREECGRKIAGKGKEGLEELNGKEGIGVEEGKKGEKRKRCKKREGKNMRMIATLIILVFVAAVMNSCASKKAEEPGPGVGSDDEPVTAEAIVQEGPVFIYDNAKILEQAPEICLAFSDEPIQLPGWGFIRLKGIISGKEPVALLDVGGRGVVARVGDDFGEYEVKEIREGCVKLGKTNASDVGTGFIPARTTASGETVGTGLVPVRFPVRGKQNE